MISQNVKPPKTDPSSGIAYHVPFLLSAYFTPPPFQMYH